MNPENCTPGILVRYYPGGRELPGYIGRVHQVPWRLGDGSMVTHLHEMEPAFGKLYVHAAFVDGLEDL
jgi:hypothetical protein